ncbi:uncharacterized protein LOC124359231 isoform X3 [Homalodisca vitripennis]|uniref:uncharacterized protein LOC124359231 isoform X3 n=1 Tax=Homalodisca vitripennis TaxID=197043 RepID=UPI001EEB4F41|nr:uncharacterized protein LOC124359231 isoform X3 [Homalodisca vitripennis]
MRSVEGLNCNVNLFGSVKKQQYSSDMFYNVLFAVLMVLCLVKPHLALIRHIKKLFSWFSRDSTQQGCTIYLHKDMSDSYEPVFLIYGKHGTELAKPTLLHNRGALYLKKGQNMIITCPGKFNRLNVGNDLRYTISTCVQGNRLLVEGAELEAADLQCVSPVMSSVRLTDRRCGHPSAAMVEIGYESFGWHRLISSCYIANRLTSLFSTHFLNGSILAGAKRTANGRPYFQHGSHVLYEGVNPEPLYRKQNQERVLTMLLGELKARYILRKTFLSRGHLAPDCDFTLGAWQAATYFYVNSAPQWQSINCGNWRRVENRIRELATTEKIDLVVTTGTYGILKLLDANGTYKNIYLDPDNKKLPVPNFFWKMVINPLTSAGIVFIISNNPFLRKSPRYVCRDVCFSHGWVQPLETNNGHKGYVYCCSIGHFRNVVEYAPDFHSKYILTFVGKNNNTSTKEKDVSRQKYIGR